MSSLLTTPKEFNTIIRGHWSIENNLNWCLDIVFKEDLSTKQAGNATENFSMISKVGLAILKKHTSIKNSLKRKRAKTECGIMNISKPYWAKKFKWVYPDIQV